MCVHTCSCIYSSVCVISPVFLVISWLLKKIKKCGKHRSITQCLESYVTLSLAEITTRTTDQKFCWKFSECETNKSGQWSYQVNLQHKHHVEITPKGVRSAEATFIWRLQNLLPLSNLYYCYVCGLHACLAQL